MGDMRFPSFPIRVQRLCVVVSLSTPVTNPLERVKIRVLHDDAELLSAEIPPEAIREGQAAAANQTVLGEDPRYSLTIEAVVHFDVTKESLIRVRVTTESEEMKANGLTLLLATKPSIEAHPPN